VASQATVGFSNLTSCYLSITCFNCISCSFIFVTWQTFWYSIRDRLFHSHHTLPIKPPQISACLYSCITYLFIHENKSNRFGRFALRNCVNKMNIRCWPNVRPSSNFHVCRMPYNRCTQIWLWGWLHLLCLQIDDQVHSELYLMRISASWEN
jgi:hypothetical protein